MTILGGPESAESGAVTAAETVGTAGWAVQDDVLRDLWQRGDSPVAIAAALQRSVPAIMTRAARLGLPRRFAPGRKPMREGQEKPPRQQQARARGPVTVKLPSNPPVTGQPVVERICLMCLAKFPSMGRHNRICSNCKDSPDYEAGNRLPDLDFPV